MLINGAQAHSFFSLPPDSLKRSADTLRKSIDTLSANDEETALDSKVDYTAEDSIRMEAENKKIYLFGKATVHYQDFDLKADYIEIDNNSHLITATGMPDSAGVMQGTPEFKQGADQMRSQKMVYNFQTKKGKIYGLLTKQQEMYVYGEQVKKDSNNIMYLKRMKCIPCQFEDGMIYFRASKAKIIPNDKIITGPVFVEVSNIPLPAGLPFGFFPNVKKEKSKRGIIIPTFGYSASQGFFMQNLGFFMPINDKVHVTLFANYYSSGNWALNASTGISEPMLRYKVNYKYSGSLNIGFSHFVSGIPENHLPGTPNYYYTNNNFRINWTHTQDNKNNPTVRFSASVNAGSPNFSKYNNQSAAMYTASTLLSSVMYAKTYRFAMLNFGLRSSQNLSTHAIQIDAPQLTFAINRLYPFKKSVPRNKNKWLDQLHVDYTLQTKVSANTYDSILFKPQGINQIQYGWQQSVPIATNISFLKYFILTPSASFQQYTSFQTTETHYDASSNTVSSFIRKDPMYAFAYDQNYQANLSSKVYGDYVFKSKWLKQIRHQIIPTVGFAYHPDMQDSHSFFQKIQTGIDANNMPVYTYYSRFQNSMFGGPAGPQSGSINFNINNTFDAKVRQKTDTSVSYKKIPLLQMLSIFGSYNVAAKTNKWSLLNLSARTSFIKNIITVMYTAAFDPYKLNINNQRSDTLGAPRLTNYNFSVNGNLNNSHFKAFKDSKQPFTVSMGYNLVYNKNPSLSALASPNLSATPNAYSQNLTASFSLMPTPMWKINITTGYDFKNKNLSYTNFTIYRDLRCWEARLTWVPFGYSKQYTITFNLKTSALNTMKIPKQKLWQDNL